ncbi:hypothetical protein PCE1_001085 [Barthelona sp. PCE]
MHKRGHYALSHCKFRCFDSGEELRAFLDEGVRMTKEEHVAFNLEHHLNKDLYRSSEIFKLEELENDIDIMERAHACFGLPSIVSHQLTSIAFSPFQNVADRILVIPDSYNNPGTLIYSAQESLRRFERTKHVANNRNWDREFFSGVDMLSLSLQQARDRVEQILSDLEKNVYQVSDTVKGFIQALEICLSLQKHCFTHDDDIEAKEVSCWCDERFSKIFLAVFNSHETFFEFIAAGVPMQQTVFSKNFVTEEAAEASGLAMNL